MTLAEQIQAAQAAINVDTAALEALTVKMAEAPADETLLTQVDALATTLDGRRKSLETLTKAERSLAARAQPIGGPGTGSPLVLSAQHREKGNIELLVRAAVVALEAHIFKRSPEECFKARYSDAGEATRIMVGLTTKVATPQGPAMSNVAGYAAELVHQTYAAFMDALVGQACVPEIPFVSVGTFETGAPIVIPYRAQRAAYPANFDAAFRKEGDPIRVGRLTTASHTMSPYTMGVIGSFTKELFKRSTPNIEALIRQAMLEDTAEMLDGYVFSATAAVVGQQPAGLLNGIQAADTGASSGATFDDINTDLQARVKQLFTVRRLGKNAVWVMNTANKMALASITNPLGTWPFRDEVATGKLKGLPIVAGLYIDPTRVFLVDGGAIAWAGGIPIFEASDQATIHEESDTPQPLVQGAGTATPARSLFQTHSAAIKSLWELSWLQLYPGAVQEITGVAW